MAGISQLDILLLGRSNFVRRLMGADNRPLAVAQTYSGSLQSGTTPPPAGAGPDPNPDYRRNLALNTSFEYFDRGSETPKAWSAFGGASLVIGALNAEGGCTVRFQVGGLLTQTLPQPSFEQGAVVLSVYARTSTPGSRLDLTVNHGTAYAQAAPIYREDEYGNIVAADDIPADGTWYRFYRSYIIQGGQGLLINIGWRGGDFEIDSVKFEHQRGAAGFIQPTAYETQDYGGAQHIRDLSADNITTGRLRVGGSDSPSIVVEDDQGNSLVSIGQGFAGIEVRGAGSLRVTGAGGVSVEGIGSIRAGSGGNRVEMAATGIKGYGGGTEQISLDAADGKIKVSGAGGIEINPAGSIKAGQALLARNKLVVAENGVDPAAVTADSRYVQLDQDGLFVSRGAIKVRDDQGAVIIEGKGLTELAMRKNELRNPSFEVWDNGSPVPRQWRFLTGAVHKRDAVLADGLATAYLPPNGAIEQDVNLPVCSGVLSFYVRAMAGASGPAPLQPPQNLVATVIDAYTVTLTWDDPNTVEDGYEIYRSDDGRQSWVKVGEVGPDETTFTDNTLSPATTYHYVVNAFNGSGWSEDAGPVEVTTVPLAGGGVQTYQLGDTNTNYSTMLRHNDRLRAYNKRQVPHSGAVLRRVKAYMEGGTGGPQAFRAVLYKHSPSLNQPDALVAVSAEVVIPQNAPRQWFTFEMPNAPLEQNAEYWVGLWFGSTPTTGRAGLMQSGSTGATDIEHYRGVTYSATGSPPNPWGSTATNSRNTSIYFEYEVGSGSGGPNPTGNVPPGTTYTPNTSGSSGQTTLHLSLLDSADQELMTEPMRLVDADGNETVTDSIPGDGNWYRVYRQFNNTAAQNAIVRVWNNSASVGDVELDRGKLEFGAAGKRINPTVYTNTDWSLAYQIRDFKAENITTGRLWVRGEMGILAGNPTGGRTEMKPTGFYGVDSNNVEQVSISATDGKLRAAGGTFVLGANGPSVVATTTYENRRGYTFNAEDGRSFGGLQAVTFNNADGSVSDYIRLSTFKATNRQSNIVIEAEGDNVGAYARLSVNSNLRTAGFTTYVTTSGSAPETESIIAGDRILLLGTICDAGGRVIRDANGGWVRTYGETGWYNQTYGGGWYMLDTDWIRSYNNKSVYTSGVMRADSGFRTLGGGSRNQEVSGGIFVPFPAMVAILNGNTLGVAPNWTTDYYWLPGYGVPQAAKAVAIRAGLKWATASEGGVWKFSGNASAVAAVLRATVGNIFVDLHAIIPLNGSGYLYTDVDGNAPVAGSAYLYIIGYFI